MLLIRGIIFVVLGVICYIIARSIHLGVGFKRHEQVRWFREIILFLFTIYICMVVSVTLFPLPIGFPSHIEYIDRLINVKPLVTIIDNIKQIGIAYGGDTNFMIGLIMRNVGGNILLLMPLGFFAPILWKKYKSFKHILILGFTVSISIEILQFVENLILGGYGRISDIDDVICNVLGVIIGFVMFRLVYKVANKIRGKKELNLQV